MSVKMEKYYQVLSELDASTKYRVQIRGSEVIITVGELCDLYHTDPELFAEYVEAISQVGADRNKMLEESKSAKNAYVYSGTSISEVRDKLILDECEALSGMRWMPTEKYYEIMDAFAAAHQKLDSKENGDRLQ